MLDVDFSPYPYATGSNVVTGAVNTGCGIQVSKIDNIWAVVKAYLSRVGGGPLPTELFDKNAERIRERGHEYGTTTGRPRRIGWLDLEAVKFAVRVTGANKIAITKIDILSGLKEIKVCVGYRYRGKDIPYSSCGYLELARLTPIYKTFPGWNEDIGGIRDFRKLPKNCQNYVKFIEKFLNVKVGIVSVGPEREANIYL
jgi:adenylosuccinate synthase